MSCPSCNGALTALPSGSLARCGSCGGYVGYGGGLARTSVVSLVLAGPWLLRTRDELADEADDQDFEQRAAAPPTGPASKLKFIVPVVVLVTMVVIAASVVLGLQKSEPEAPAVGATAGAKAPKTSPPAKKK
jgi:hypothetical protein